MSSDTDDIEICDDIFSYQRWKNLRDDFTFQNEQKLRDTPVNCDNSRKKNGLIDKTGIETNYGGVESKFCRVNDCFPFALINQCSDGSALKSWSENCTFCYKWYS